MLKDFQSLNVLKPMLASSGYACGGLSRGLKTPSELFIRVTATLLPGAEFAWSDHGGVDHLFCKYMYVLAQESGEISPPKTSDRIEMAIEDSTMALLRISILNDVREMGSKNFPLSPAFWRQLGEEDRALEAEALEINFQGAPPPPPMINGKRKRRTPANQFDVESITAERSGGREVLVRWAGYHPTCEAWRCTGAVGDPVETW